MTGEQILKKAQDLWNKRNKPTGKYAKRIPAKDGLKILGGAVKNKIQSLTQKKMGSTTGTTTPNYEEIERKKRRAGL